MAPNPYLTANFAPVADEVTVADLDVDGSIPPALTGRYLRSGPNPIAPDPANHHWFVGDGMLHGVRLDGGEARWYRNRWVDTSRSVAHTGRLVPEGPGGDIEGSGNTNVVHHAGVTFAINELSVPYEIGPELETIRRHDFGGPMPAGMTAHPKFDPVTGEMHVMAYHFVEPYLRYHVVDAAGRLVRTEVLDVGGPIMVHDMGLTETRVLAFDLPVVFDLDLVAEGRLPYRWRDDYRARVGLMPRSGSGADTRWVDLDPCYVFHPLNAYDDGERVVVDVVRYDTMFRSDHRGPSDSAQTFERWTIDPTEAKVLRDVRDDRPQEFPRADERLATLPHRFGYCVAGTFPQLGGIDRSGTDLLKHDTTTGRTEVHDFGPGRAAGEFVFVPSTPDAGEDEGWLLGYVHDAATDTSDLVILDAHDFGHHVATVHLPVRVPAGFHGTWIPDRAVDAAGAPRMAAWER